MSKPSKEARKDPVGRRRTSPVCMYSGLMFAIAPTDHWPPPPPPSAIPARQRVKHKAVQKTPPQSIIASTPQDSTPSLVSKPATSNTNILGTIRRNIIPTRSMEFGFRRKGSSDRGSTSSLGMEDKTKPKSLTRRRSNKSTTVASLRSLGSYIDIPKLKHTQSLELGRADSRMTVQSSPGTTSCLVIPRAEGSSDNGSFSASSSSSNIVSPLPVLPSLDAVAMNPGPSENDFESPLEGPSRLLAVSVPGNSPSSIDDVTTPTQSSVSTSVQTKPFLAADPAMYGETSRVCSSKYSSMRTHGRSVSTPSASVSTSRSVTPLTTEEEEEEDKYEDDDSDDGILRFASPLASPCSTSLHYAAKDNPGLRIDIEDRISVRSIRPTPPPSPLVFAHRPSIESAGGPTTVAFPDMEAFLAFQAKNRRASRVSRSKTISHHPFSKFSLSGPILKKPQPASTGVGWTGRWNKPDMQEVIQSLRELK